MDDLVDALRAASDATRLRILGLCARADLSVLDLVRVLGQSQPLVSHHLKRLTDAGLLIRYREGQQVYHRIGNDDQGGRVARAVVGLITPEERGLATDLARLHDIRRARHDAAANYFSANARNWDRIRSLHVDDAKVEAAIKTLIGGVKLAKLLDIGTGTGRMLQLLGPQAKDAVGIDNNRDMLRMARDRLDGTDLRNCHVRQGDMYRLPWPDGTYGGAVLHQVLHYAERPGAVIAEAARVLCPAGWLLIADFAPHQLDELRAEHAHHWLGFADPTIIGWCNDAGLSVERTKRLRGKPLTVSLWLARRRARTGADTRDHAA